MNLQVNREFTAGLLDPDSEAIHSPHKHTAAPNLGADRVKKSVKLTLGLGVGALAMSTVFFWKPNTRIQVVKAATNDGGIYRVSGRGYEPGETVSLEIKGAPLSQPSGWQLGSIDAVNGTFSFQSEEFRCVHVEPAALREGYKHQSVIFVATGLRSGHVATAIETAEGPLICP